MKGALTSTDRKLLSQGYLFSHEMLSIQRFCCPLPPSAARMKPLLSPCVHSPQPPRSEPLPALPEPLPAAGMAQAALAVEQRCSLLGSRGWALRLPCLAFGEKNGLPGLPWTLGVSVTARNACG